MIAIIKNTLIQPSGNTKHEDNKSGENNKVIRKSLTLDDDNNDTLNSFRGKLLADKGIDLDFTRAVNMLIALASHRLANAELTPEENRIVNRYIFGVQDLEIVAITDMQWDKWFEYEYPKIVEELQNLRKKSKSNSAKGKKSEGIHKLV